ncbi:MAG: carbonic anhydrase [Pacificimonas sp.]|jgi:carbonic anhydrase|nr:carbonic anhydrase [Pacificimonas sp.]
MPEFQALLDGYRRFRNGNYQDQRRRYDRLAVKGQHPGLMVIGCCDSRVDPAMIFDVEPGQVFVLRNVANLVPPYETGGGLHGVSAALEFAVKGLEVHYIVVMGHAQCGGIKAALANGGHEDDGFIGDWMEILRVERDRIAALAEKHPDLDGQKALEQAAVRVSLNNLRSFPWVREREAAGTLRLEGTYFGIAEGILYRLDHDTDHFIPLDPDEEIGT